MSCEDMPSFPEAILKMEDFLRHLDKPTKIEWIFQDDATGYKRQMWIRLPVPITNVNIARSMYEVGVECGLGVQINAIRLSCDTVYCYIWFPADETDAEYAMISGFKLSVRNPLLLAHEVHSRFLWHRYSRP